MNYDWKLMQLKQNRTEIEKKLNKCKNWFFEKMSKMGRFLFQLSEKRRQPKPTESEINWFC